MSSIDPDVQVKLAELDERLRSDFQTEIRRLEARIDNLPTGPTDPGPTDPPAWTPAFPGDVPPGKVRWGAGINGNGDPVTRHEMQAGVPMGVRRTFFGWRHINSGYLMDVVNNDLAAGRVPWVSLKTPGWRAMADGSRDDEIDGMLAKLDATGGPVWLTIHHEPEGGNGTPYPDEGEGTEGNWLAMQVRVRERMTAVGTTNIAFASCLMTWTFDPRSGRTPSDWWADGIWDFAGLDHYMDKESAQSIFSNSDGWENAYEFYSGTYAFYSGKGIPVALGEWGNRGTDGAAAAEMQSFYDLGVASASSDGSRIIAFSAFDSNLNSPTGGWELKGEPLARFRELMKAPTSARL